jgi:hypothetical protein
MRTTTFTLLLWLAPSLLAAEPAHKRPTMAEFMGINGHTIQFKPELYARVCRKVRDYHSLEWDLGRDTDFVPEFPFARNRVDWNSVYGSWKKAGFESDVCIMFNNTPPDSWKDLPRDARTYGRAFAKAFGPSGERPLVTSVEIGNEPGEYSDERYRELFAAMAAGLREGDTGEGNEKLQVLTCNMTAGKSGKYEKSVACVAGLDKLYDVLTTHTYAMADGWPTWRRSYPEDPKIDFLKTVQALIDWRDEHAQGKPVWVTEFGWDASTTPRATSGDAAKWEGNVSDERQAQYLTRAFLMFASMDVERAYLYFFNDKNEPSFHAASGITRNYEPKPSFYALEHLYKTLGEYRFARVIWKKEGAAYAFEFVHGKEPQRSIVVAWSPTGSDRKATMELPLDGAKIVKAERMPLKEGKADALPIAVEEGALVELSESPVYVWMER